MAPEWRRRRRESDWRSVVWEWRSLSRLRQKCRIPCQKVWTKVWIEPAKVWIAPAKVVNRRSHPPEKCESPWIDGEVFGRGGCALAGDSRFTVRGGVWKFTRLFLGPERSSQRGHVNGNCFGRIGTGVWKFRNVHVVTFDQAFGKLQDLQLSFTPEHPRTNFANPNFDNPSKIRQINAVVLHRFSRRQKNFCTLMKGCWWTTGR